MGRGGEGLGEMIWKELMLMYLNRCSPLKPSLNIYVFQWEIRIDTALQEKEKFLPTYM